MKRYLSYVFFLVVLAVSCETVDPSLTPPATELVPRANVSTKGFVEGTTLENHDGTDRKLVLSCWLRTQNGMAYNYFFQEIFSSQPDGWHADPPIYVPFASSFDLLGYSASVPIPNQDIIWGTPKYVERMRYSLSREHIYDDVLYGSIYGIGSMQASSINMTMFHSQAWVEVRIRLKDGAASDRHVKIHSAALLATYFGCDITVEANEGTPVAYVDLRHHYGDDLPLQISSGAFDTDLDYNGIAMRILVPQQDQTKLFLDYEIYGCPLTCTADLAPTRATWEMGKKYIYEFLVDPLNTVPILASVTVTDWDSGIEYTEGI